MNRRRFCATIAAVPAAAASGVWLLLKKATPQRIIVAVRAKVCPGEIRALDETEIAKPAEWAG